jgi:Lon protease-like protein
MDELLMPLFPLELVLFPGEPLPLHIFEDRYKGMIGECLAKGEIEPAGGEFGVVRQKGGEADRVGCTAHITRVVRRYADGRLDILTTVQRRFEILFTNTGKSYLGGAVNFFDDDEGVTPAESEKERGRCLFLDVLARLEIAGGESALATDLKKPSFPIAASLPIGLDFKQRLLAMRSEKERLDALIDLMEKLIPAPKERARVRSRASGNGHALRAPGPGSLPSG